METGLLGVKMKEKEKNSRIYIVEGVQGSGKTTATGYLSQKNGCRSFRGIPSGQELTNNCEAENWRQSMNIFELALNSSNGITTIMDRSIWSLVAYNIGKKPDCHLLIYGLGKRMFDRRLMKEEFGCTIVFLEVNPSLSFQREDNSGFHSRGSIEEVIVETQVYSWLMEKLERDGYDVIRVKNNDVSKREFLGLVEQAIMVNV